MTAFNIIVIGFLFGIGFVLANTVLMLIDKILALILLKYRLKQITKVKDKPKPPEGLNFGSKIK